VQFGDLIFSVLLSLVFGPGIQSIVLKIGPVTEPARSSVHGLLVGPLVQTGLILVF
jgi:hypothetical protein